MAPVVHFQHSIVHRQVLDARHQFVVEHEACAVEAFVVHAYGQNKMIEQLVGDRFSPLGFRAGGKRAAHIRQIELTAVVGDVAYCHVGIEKGHGFPFFGTHFRVENGEKVAFGELCFFVFKITVYTFPIGIGLAAGGKQQRQ